MAPAAALFRRRESGNVNQCARARRHALISVRCTHALCFCVYIINARDIRVCVFTAAECAVFYGWVAERVSQRGYIARGFVNFS